MYVVGLVSVGSGILLTGISVPGPGKSSRGKVWEEL